MIQIEKIGESSAPWMTKSQPGDFQFVAWEIYNANNPDNTILDIVLPGANNAFVTMLDAEELGTEEIVIGAKYRVIWFNLY